MIKTRLAARVLTGLVAVPAISMLAMGPAFAASSGDVTVTNTETVQAYLDATGKVDVARVYEQVAFQGKGTVDLKNPVETQGLRNLDGFGGFDVKDGNMVGSYTVDGEKHLRSVSDYTKKLPIDVKVAYQLDGKPVEPGDVVGKSGILSVEYTVRNLTGKPTTVSFDDGTGVTKTASEDVVIPMIGSLSTGLPKNFTDVESAEANMAGDGRGGTKLSFTMTLFGPIGKPEAKFGYTAKITDGVVPPASMSIVPVSPLDSPSFKGGAASYKSGADTGVQLTAGATEIDSNLLKLRDGAGQLLAGLIQLRDGAYKLSDGTGTLTDGTGQLRSGAAQLAAGANTAKSGADQLAGGSGQVYNGLVQAGSKAPALIGGLDQVADGLEKVDAGLVQLYGGIGQLPDKAKPLHAGIQQMLAGLGDKATAGTLIYGVDQVRAGLAEATAAGGPVDQLKGGVDQVKAGHDAALAPGGSIDELGGGFDTIAATPDCLAICQATLAVVKGQALSKLRDSSTQASAGLGQVSAGLAQLKGKLDSHLPGTYGASDPGGAGFALARVECGLNNQTLAGICDPNTPGLLQGLGQVDAGVTQLVNGVVAQVQGGVGTATDTPANNTLRGGVNGLQAGVGQLQAGGDTLLSGINQLTAGSKLVAEGNAALSGGVGQLASGANQLAGGAVRLDDGAKQLGDGANLLANGLTTAAASAPQLEDGAQRLSTEGMSKLVAAGKATAADYGNKYAQIAAGAERAKTEGMAYGAPEGAEKAMAYSFELSGADSEGSRNLLRGLGAVVLLGAGAAVPFLRRRGTAA